MIVAESEGERAPTWAAALSFLLPILVFCIASAGTAWRIQERNEGQFCYALDDAYIHLSLAREIGEQLHYGVQPGEVSAPSSSILWPFLLAPFAASTAFVLVPWAIAFAAALLFLLVAQDVVWRALVPKSRRAALAAAVIGCAWVFSSNLVALVFTGMEHTLQLLLGALIVRGMQRFASGQRPGWLLNVGIVLAPLVRYELLGASLVGCTLLAVNGHRRRGLVLAGLTLAPIAAFSAFLNHQGLGLLPTSVQAKLGSFDSGAIAGIRRNLGLVLRLREAGVLGLLGAILGATFFGLKKDDSLRLPALFGCAAVGGHLLFGRYGWFDRYEIYVVSLGLLSLVAAWGPALGRIAAELPLARWTAASILIFAAAFPSYALRLKDVPGAASNVFSQQYQMGRFLADHYPRRAAVNDLGAVVFQSPHHVLDLFGLSSFRALKQRLSGNPGWMAEELRAADTHFAMIYDELFVDQIPDRWIKVAQLSLCEPRISAAFSKVSFYIADPKDLPNLRSALEDFQKGLPPTAKLRILP